QPPVPRERPHAGHPRRLRPVQRGPSCEETTGDVMSSPPLPEPTPPGPKWDRRRYVLAILLASVFVIPLLWLSWVRYVRDATPGDDSIVIDARRKTNDGRTVVSGRIYSQAQVDLPPGTELVLPVTRMERPDPGFHPQMRVLMRTD